MNTRAFIAKISSNMDAVFIYVTCKSKEEAAQIGHSCVEKGLVACANILDSISSIYKWQDKIEHEKESLLILKSVEANFQRVKKLVEEEHSYECPCIISFKVDKVSEAYGKWIEAAVSS